MYITNVSVQSISGSHKQMLMVPGPFGVGCLPIMTCAAANGGYMPLGDRS
jgi:hypothetical protein